MDRIEILSVDLLESRRQLVEQFRRLADELTVGLGWHYLLDFAWAASQLQVKPGVRVLDAGAAYGTMQWWLANRGASVISVDRVSRADLPQKFRNHYRIVGLRPQDVSARSRWQGVRSFLPPRSPRRWRNYPAKLSAALNALVPQFSEKEPGTVFIYNQDVRNMPDIASNGVDAVVSISALEHNHSRELRDCVSELMRVLKPGGQLVVTLAAARDEDWFHEPSKGWCYTEASLREIFDLPGDCPSNFDRYDELFEAIRNSGELQENLADFYFKSGDSGMPWGIWDPKYQPVGVLRVKRKE